MNARTRIRRTVLGLLLTATLGLTVWTHQRKQMEEVSEPLARRPSPGAPHRADAGSAAPLPAVADADAAGTPEPAHDPFFVTQWEPPAPPPPPPPPPAPPPPPVLPVAPPLPFRYVGRHELADGPASETQYFLSQGDTAWAVRPGEALGDAYRFEGADAQGNLLFVYLPLGTQQRLSIGAEP